ncbi:hypothetical protein PSENEW3_00001253 [Picochlorum sp. SENEW3]|nr:hypothetical protein PSENEW3_00001253 [Picochlorum sp. SENEW3]
MTAPGSWGTIREALIWADFGFGGNEAFPAVASFGDLKMADFGGSKSEIDLGGPDGLSSVVVGFVMVDLGASRQNK